MTEDRMTKGKMTIGKMTIEEMKRRKRILGMTSEKISSASGIPLSTVQKIFSGVTQSPRRSTMEAIAAVLMQEESATDGREAPAFNGNLNRNYYGNFNGSSNENDAADRISYSYMDTYGGGNPGAGLRDMVEEAAGAYYVTPKTGPVEKRPGEYTIDDYYALPDERRVELIDGVFYEMLAPAIIHQKILGELFVLFRECMDRHEGTCEVYLAPCDVRLDRDNRTMVQPDLLIVCGEYDIGAKRFEGAPDLTLEILSPSTRSKDMLLKLHKYANAGVREYWIVDPDRKTVLAYDLEHENYYPEKYSFNDEIPILISGGECRIDFSRIMRRIERYYQ